MPTNKANNQVRIIGGQWRGSKILLPSGLEHIRPTTDRIRETLFNWLTPYIVGARCLDCFAGSGALGFEAISRGAASAVMIDHDSTVCKTLKENIDRLKLPNCTVQRGSVPDVELNGEPFNIIFLDPPYHQNLLIPSLRWLDKQGVISETTIIYVETEIEFEFKDLPENFKIVKEKSTKKINYGLLELLS